MLIPQSSVVNSKPLSQLRQASALSKQQGFSLPEIILGLGLGVAALAAITSVVGYGIGVNANLIASARLNEEVSNVFSLMQRDIRRAGYFGGTIAQVTDPDTVVNPFAGLLTTSAYAGEAANSCITFAYDLDNDGTLDANEQFGYRLKDEVLEMRQNALLCTDDNWLALTDDSVVEITGMTFTVNSVVSGGVTTTSVDINLQAELDANANISRQYATTLVVRNYGS